MMQGVPTILPNQQEANYLVNYHATSDTFDKVDFAQLKKNEAMAAELMVELANAPQRIGPRLTRTQIEGTFRPNPLVQMSRTPPPRRSAFPARLLLCRSRRFRLRRLSRRLKDLDANDLGRVAWPIGARIGRHARDLLHHVDVLALSEDGVVAVEVGRGNVGNEELRAVGIGPAIGHRQASRLVELERGAELIFEAVAGITGSVTDGVATLNHEVWDDPVEDGAVVQRHTLHRLAGLGICPLFGSRRQPDEVGDRQRRLTRKERAGDVARRSRSEEHTSEL